MHIDGFGAKHWSSLKRIVGTDRDLYTKGKLSAKYLQTVKSGLSALLSADCSPFRPSFRTSLCRPPIRQQSPPPTITYSVANITQKSREEWHQFLNNKTDSRHSHVSHPCCVIPLRHLTYPYVIPAVDVPHSTFHTRRSPLDGRCRASLTPSPAS